ncbi:MAG: 2,3-cyclic-nucleotide 2-phosphodiesterase, partial [Gaiellales bacterium]|nr:2,3-cyclic-nucleotide 2-phosphodiesterase [Gaiellales bacterium]
AQSPRVRVLFIGDVVGSAGRRVVEEMLPGLRESERPDFVVVNGENASGGAGITEKVAKAIFAAGADAITLGNHAFRHRDVYQYLEREARIVRPSNYPMAAPGRGHTVVESDGQRLAVVNISGMVFLDAARSPFAEADAVLGELRDRADHVLVDFHAEATSEKVAMGRLLDGRVTAVLGTHTHVQTSDAAVLPGGTAYITDAGMSGPHDSVIGVRAELILRRFQTGLPVRFEPAEGGVRIEGAVIECDAATGRAQSIAAFRLTDAS